MEPRVTKREKKLHLRYKSIKLSTKFHSLTRPNSYDLPSRIYCSRIYPIAAPNGSTVILYGHDRGLRVLWRGGRRPKEPSAAPTAPPNASGTGTGPEVITIDDSDDEPEQNEPKAVVDEYEAEEDEEDPDSPFPSIIYHADIDLGAEVLSMAVPSITSTAALQAPKLANTHAIVVLGCANAKVTLMSIPLAPSDAERQVHDKAVFNIQLEGDGSISHDLAIKLMPKDDERLDRARSRSGRSDSADVDGRLLIASVATGLNVWNLRLTPSSIAHTRESVLPIVHSPLPGSAVSFHTSARLNRLLVADRAGAVRIYDPFEPSASSQRRSSQDSASGAPASNEEFGRWIVSYNTPFHSPKDNPALARRKKILDAEWVLGGRGILALLEDGEWGVWDLSGVTQADKSAENFTLRGFLSSSRTAEAAESAKQKKSGAKLAPMTPNTRKSKSETLFSGTPKAAGVAATGGISFATSSNRAGQVDESVIIWYHNDIYSITSMQSFWQRSAASSSGGFGSLYAPGLTHISDINPINENITSVSQFASKSSGSGLGEMKTQRDLLVSAEHRFVISQSLRQPDPHKDLFQQPTGRPDSRDQRMLDAGDLDLGGMDRMLDSMAGDGRTRKVGFAH